jgi:Flp pilus assembly protein TadD
LVSVGLLATGSVDKTYGLDLIWSFYLPANFYEVIFLLGLVVQFLFLTTLITFGTVLGLCGLFVASSLLYGSSVVISPFDASVFLGLTLLVTDPSTTPRTKVGKFLFGLTYGCVILCTFILLRYLRQPSYFDKILAVPLMNLMVVMFDGVGVRVQGWMSKSWMPVARYERAASMCAYTALFVAILPWLKVPDPEFVDPLPFAAIQTSVPMRELRAKHIALRLQYPELNRPFSFRSEWIRLRNADQFEPVTAEECNSLGMAYLQLDQPGQALGYFQQAVDIDPSYGPSQRNLGNARLQQGDVAVAIDHLRKALQVDDADATAHRFLGTALATQGHLIEAVNHLQQALQFNAADSRAHLDLGSLLASQGKLAQAKSHYRHALAINPNIGMAHYNLGQTLVIERKFDEGLRHLRRAQKLMPDVPQVREALDTVQSIQQF